MALTEQQRRDVYQRLEGQIRDLLGVHGQIAALRAGGDAVNPASVQRPITLDGTFTNQERDYVSTVLGLEIPKGDFAQSDSQLSKFEDDLRRKGQELSVKLAAQQGITAGPSGKSGLPEAKAQAEARQAERDRLSGEFDREIPYGVTPQIHVDRPWLEPGLSQEEYEARARAAENDPATDLEARIAAVEAEKQIIAGYGPQLKPPDIRPDLPENSAGTDPQQAMAVLLHYARMGNDLTGSDVAFKPLPDEMELFSMGLVDMEPGEALAQLKQNLNAGDYDQVLKANIEFDLKKLGRPDLSGEERDGILDRLEQVQKLMGPDFIAKLDIQDGAGRDLPQGGLGKGLLQERFGAAADGLQVPAAPMLSPEPAPRQQPAGPQ